MRKLSREPAPPGASLRVVPDESRSPLGPTERTALRRKRERGNHDRDIVNGILDEGLVAHVGFVTPHGPLVLPMTYVRIGEDLYLHGAAGNDLLRRLATGVDVCVTVTLLDGLVFARSAFHHSMNYRSVVLLGRAARVTDLAEMRVASAGLLDHLAPGRSLDARPPTDDELRATLLVRLSIREGSAKVRAGGPIEDPADLDLPIWAGELPLRLAADAERADDLGRPQPTPSYITRHSLR
jgi:nitroimidazol reductase NimA-like FMN-containing flavoprotein (pyridoxamine 5'-phosphate oxidase superfamily)